MKAFMLPDFANSSYTGTLPNRQVHGGGDHNPAVLVEAIVVLFAFSGVTPSAMFGVIVGLLVLSAAALHNRLSPRPF
jgi:hypothetical protein